jgi:hypothetical protein
LKESRRFVGKCHIYIQSRSISKARNQREADASKTGSAFHLLHAGFLLSLFFDSEDGGDMFPKRQLIFNGLHGVMSQKTEIFLTAALRAASPIPECMFRLLPRS